MKAIQFTQTQLDMLEKAMRYMVSNLQYEQHQAMLHNCSTGSYNKEIEDYRQLKQYISDARTA